MSWYSRIEGTISKGKDGRFHIAYRDTHGILRAESPPSGYYDEGLAIEAVKSLNRARVRVRIRGET